MIKGNTTSTEGQELARRTKRLNPQRKKKKRKLQRKRRGEERKGRGLSCAKKTIASRSQHNTYEVARGSHLEEEGAIHRGGKEVDEKNSAPERGEGRSRFRCQPKRAESPPADSQTIREEELSHRHPATVQQYSRKRKKYTQRGGKASAGERVFFGATEGFGRREKNRRGGKSSR